MYITIKRQTKYIRAFAPIYIKLNSKTVARLLENEDISLSLDFPDSLLSVRGSFNTKLTVNPNDKIIIKDNLVNILSFWGGVILILGGQFIFDLGSWPMAILTWFGITGIIASFFIQRFILEKTN